MAFFQDQGKVHGVFQEREYKNWFEYRETDNWWAQQQGLKYEVAVCSLAKRQVRYANVLKTVAYIAVDEDENGNAVLEKWQIANHRKFA